MNHETLGVGSILGCDVAKNSIVVFDSRTGRTRTIGNHPEGLAAFAASLPPDSLVVCEATGGYEAELLMAVHAAGRAAHRADARKVKAFIRSLGTLAKTDAIDARALARYGLERQATLPRWRPAEHQRDHLQRLVLTRRDLVATRQAWLNRAQAPGADSLHPHLTRLIEACQHTIDAIEADIEALLAQCRQLAETVRTLRTIPGIGPTTAVALLALMPELGQIKRRPRRPRTPSQAERKLRALQANRRRQAGGQTPPLHGSTLRQKAQSRSQGLLPTPPSQRQTTPRRHHRRHAKARRHRKRQNQIDPCHHLS